MSCNCGCGLPDGFVVQIAKDTADYKDILLTFPESLSQEIIGVLDLNKLKEITNKHLFKYLN